MSIEGDVYVDWKARSSMSNFMWFLLLSRAAEINPKKQREI